MATLRISSATPKVSNSANIWRINAIWDPGLAGGEKNKQIVSLTSDLDLHGTSWTLHGRSRPSQGRRMDSESQETHPTVAEPDLKLIQQVSVLSNCSTAALYSVVCNQTMQKDPEDDSNEIKLKMQESSKLE